jgi:hypothetical protein
MDISLAIQTGVLFLQVNIEYRFALPLRLASRV